MGTNYYLVKRKPSIQEPIHIGKSSAGWLFLFQYQNLEWLDTPVHWNSYKELKEYLNKYATGKRKPYMIINEYDEEVSFKEFIDMVDKKQNDKTCLSNKDNFTYCNNVDGYRFTYNDFS